MTFSRGCDHRRIKKNFPYGRKSVSTLECKDCGKVVTRLEIRKSKSRNKERNKEGWKR